MWKIWVALGLSLAVTVTWEAADYLRAQTRAIEEETARAADRQRWEIQKEREDREEDQWDKFWERGKYAKEGV